jgi:hypothetical protein
MLSSFDIKKNDKNKYTHVVEEVEEGGVEQVLLKTRVLWTIIVSNKIQ